MQADRVIGCSRCGKPSALVGDTLPEDKLCTWCRDSLIPGVTALRDKERDRINGKGPAEATPNGVYCSDGVRVHKCSGGDSEPDVVLLGCLATRTPAYERTFIWQVQHPFGTARVESLLPFGFRGSLTLCGADHTFSGESLDEVTNLINDKAQEILFSLYLAIAWADELGFHCHGLDKRIRDTRSLGLQVPDENG